MSEINPYSGYTVDTVLNSNPLGLVVALYQGAIDGCVTARRHLTSGDILARTKAVNRVAGILTELMTSLNHEKGGEVSQNLAQLYNYMHRRVVEAHVMQACAPLEEVEKLLGTLLEGWREAGNNLAGAATFNAPAPAPVKRDQEVMPAQYGGYMAEYADLYSRQAYSF